MAAKYLYFNAAADDAVTLPVEALQSMSHNGANTVVFEFLTDKVNGNVAITITTATDKEKEFMKDVSEAIAFGKDQFLIIADDEDQAYVSNNVGTSGSVVAAIGRDVGPKRKVEDVTGTSVAITAADSGKIYTLNNASNAAVTLTLPVITETNIGSYYEFCVVTASTGGYLIKTGDVDDTTGDIYVGGIANLTTGVEGGSKLFVSAVDNDAQISLDSGETNGAGAVGSKVKCTAVKYSASAHSHWLVEGMAATADTDGTGANILEDAS